MKTIAVTGGIGSGKTALTDYLQSLGYPVIDTDRIAHEITAPGGRAIPYILEHFGPGFLRPDGSMDRQKMRELVFHDPEQKAVLEAGTTKVIVQDVRERLAEAESAGVPLVFVAIPLLFESGTESEYDESWVVLADREIRKDRIRRRSQLPDEIIDRMIDSQISDEVRRAKATRILENNGTLAELCRVADAALTGALAE